MNVTIDKYGTIKVTLSRRNLQTLLYKLDVPDSKRTLVRVCAGDPHSDVEGELHYLEVKAEENDEHYGDRTPGEMHPREENRL